MEKKKYSVYILTFPNNKKYIGTTSQKPKYRWKNGNGYENNFLMYEDIKKYNWENVKKEIILDELDEKTAYEIEKKLILQYKSNQEKYGYNIQNGGKIGNNIVNDKTKEKIRNTLKGTRHGISLYKMKPIDVYDENDNFIKHYQCMTDCQNEMGIRKQYISLCCKGLKDKVNGYKFKYSAE